jgi:hypothetical protein
MANVVLKGIKGNAGGWIVIAVGGVFLVWLHCRDLFVDEPISMNACPRGKKLPTTNSYST